MRGAAAQVVTTDGVRVRLLRGFAVTAGEVALALPAGVHRLVAFLALEQELRSRSYVAGQLWGDVREDRARGNLRAALSRVNAVDRRIVRVEGDRLGIGEAVRADVTEVRALARALMIDAPADGADDRRAGRTERSATTAHPPGDDVDLGFDLLPDWYDDWVLFERERLRQLVLHALERLAQRHADAGDLSAAIDAGLRAVALEPLRESPHRLLMQLHLAEGNRTEALRTYDAYRDRLADELDASPTARMEALRAEAGAVGGRLNGQRPPRPSLAPPPAAARGRRFRR